MSQYSSKYASSKIAVIKQPSTMKEERLPYIDFLTDSFSLKYLDRKPVDLNRITDHLCVKIISQQSLRSSLNLLATNSRYSDLVEASFLENPYAQFFHQILRDHKKTDIFRSCRYVPPSEFHYYTNAHLNQWMENTFDSLGRSCYLWRKEQKLLMKMVELDLTLQYSHYRHISVLWEKEQSLGPKRICLRSISGDIWKKIFAKAPAVTATRLARTRSNLPPLLEEYIQSTIPVRVMAQAERSMLDCKQSWRYENSRCSYRKKTLFENGICRDYCSWNEVSSSDKTTIYNILFSRFGRDTRSADCHKIQKSLGYGYGFHDVYYVDKRPPYPVFSGTYAETFLKLYGKSLQ